MLAFASGKMFKLKKIFCLIIVLLLLAPINAVYAAVEAPFSWEHSMNITTENQEEAFGKLVECFTKIWEKFRCIEDKNCLTFEDDHEIHTEQESVIVLLRKYISKSFIILLMSLMIV